MAAETYAFCFLSNHLHLLIRVRPIEDQRALFENLSIKIPDSLHGLSYKKFKPYSASTQFGHLFNSYTKYYNKQNGRSGVLFDGRFKRINVDSEEYLMQLICYIHRNPLHHRISSDYTSYRYSSFNKILSAGKTFLNRKKVLDLIGGKENFLEAHEEFKKKLDDRYFLEK